MTRSRGVRAIADTQRSREADRLLLGEGPGAAFRPSGVLTTLEVRWIHPGRVPTDVAEALGPFADRIELREDRYLVDPWSPQLGVKIRAAVELDVKAYRGSPGDLLVRRGGGGRLELWEKWTFPLEPAAMPPPESAAWLSVRKIRRRRSFRVVDGFVVERPLTELDLPGCSIELTDVTVDETDWWTLGLEASGDPETRDRDLQAIVESLLEVPLPDGTLDPAASMSYAQWLGSGANLGIGQGRNVHPVGG
jgi:hypothetical protein